ncbi:6-phosphogluconolactonase [Candidatus Peregrinibacteria bacterium]|nr:6-phosphogluconolactonase [Candidatus Peregrinibacteria bacterium]MBI3816591.1 6-phosphogluconolactonase [Candidatus Peregrinibacteria bacterium]
MHYGRIDAATDREFTEKSVRLLTLHIKTFVEAQGRCIIGLSGGSTPKPIYEAMGKEKTIAWNKIWFFLVDDRYVPAEHADSNQKLVRETLLRHLSIPKHQIVFPHTALPLKECVADYDARIGSMLEDGPVDIVTLGLGDDGHIASLFPPLSDDALDEDRNVIHTTTPSARSGQAARFAVHDRISLALPILAAAKISVFFLKGEAKLKVWNQMTDTEEFDPKRWPAHAVLKSGRATAVMGP